MLVLPQLPLSKFIFTFNYKGINQLPAYSGSTWRGAFGHALKQTVCVVRNTACKDCPLLFTCAYPYIFETPPPPHTEKMRLYDVAPHPFVIKTTLQTTPQTEQIDLAITLFGKSQRYLPYLIHAFDKAGKQGMGKNRQIFTLKRVTQHTKTGQHITYQDGQLMPIIAPENINLPEIPKQISLQLDTPLRIKQEDKYCNEERINFYGFFGNLLRRISMLTYFHTDTPLSTDFALLMAQAKTIALHDKQLSWQDWTRYSNRQQTTMEMGGLVGSFTLTGDLAHFWPYLWLGQWTHAGKGTSMGLGAYRISAASLPALPL